MSSSIKLLRKINKAIPKEKSKRLFELQTKQKKIILSDKEKNELLQLVDYIEELEAKRLKNMLELAGLKNMTLEQLRKSINLPIVPVYVW